MCEGDICCLPFQVEQYKNVVFYGPIGASKTFLAKKLAKCVQVSINAKVYIQVVVCKLALL